MNDDESTMKKAVATTTNAPANASKVYLRILLLSEVCTSVLSGFVLFDLVS
jgi:hypothetical protein